MIVLNFVSFAGSQTLEGAAVIPTLQCLVHAQWCVIYFFSGIVAYEVATFRSAPRTALKKNLSGSAWTDRLARCTVLVCAVVSWFRANIFVPSPRVAQESFLYRKR